MPILRPDHLIVTITQTADVLTSTAPEQSLPNTIAQGVLQNKEAALILCRALATAIIIYAFAKSAAEIISAWRK